MSSSSPPPVSLPPPDVSDWLPPPPVPPPLFASKNIFPIFDNKFIIVLYRCQQESYFFFKEIISLKAFSTSLIYSKFPCSLSRVRSSTPTIRLCKLDRKSV